MTTLQALIPGFGRRAGAALAASRSPFENPAVLAGLFLVALAAMYDPRDIRAVLVSLRLPDTDDAMRLVDVRALVAGQGWFDGIQHRFFPPSGIQSHWSRLVDAPLAGLILALTPLVGARTAEGITAAFWPVATFAAYAGALFLAVRRAFGLRPAWLALFVACQTAAIAGLFAFGRIDHHNLQICAVFGVVAGLSARAPGRAGAALAGALAGLSLAIGLETLPYIAALGVVVVLLWVRDGEAEAPRLTAFGLALALAAPILFVLQTAPARWGAAACDALSPPWLWLAAGAGLAALLPRLGLSTPRGRLLAAAGLGAGVAAGYAVLFPACLGGPFAHLPPLVIARWVKEVQEAKPFWGHLAADPLAALTNVMPIVVGALAAAWLARRLRGGPEFRLLLLSAVMLGVGTVVVQFQMRGIYVSSAFVPVVGGLALERAFAALRDPGAGPARRWLPLGLALLLVGKVWALALGLPRALADGSTMATVAESDTVRAWRTCTDPANLAALDALPPGLILAPIDFGPMLLLHTRHAVVAAPYHRAGEALLAGLESFDGSEADLRRHAGRLGVDYVLVCTPMQGEPPGLPVPFATRLARGEATPDWLRRVDLPAGPIQVWQPR